MLHVKLIEPPYTEPYVRWCERSEFLKLREIPPTRLNDMTEEKRKLKLIIFPGETVVIDEYGKRIVACPTEDEAEEYIREQEE